jgi:uncharacterized protein (TIGR02246 family)
MRPKNSCAALLAGALLSAVPYSLAPAAAQAPPAQDGALPADALSAIRAANDDWLPALKRGDAAAIAAPYAADGLFVTTSGEVVHGRDAVRELYAQRMAHIKKVMGGELVEEGTARVSDTLVYEWGHGTLTVQKEDGSESRGGGPYLTVWRRGSDGRWQISRNLVL